MSSLEKPKRLTGVAYDGTRRIKKFKAVLRKQGKLKHLGYFRTELEAHEAFLKAKDEK